MAILTADEMQDLKEEISSKPENFKIVYTKPLHQEICESPKIHVASDGKKHFICYSGRYEDKYSRQTDDGMVCVSESLDYLANGAQKYEGKKGLRRAHADMIKEIQREGMIEKVRCVFPDEF